MTDHAHELRRHARKIAHPAGDVPAVMLAAADEIERLRTESAGLVDDMNLLRDNNTALRAHVEAMGQQEPYSYIYEYSNPIDGSPVWRDMPGYWNAQFPKSSKPLYLAPGAQPAPIIPEGWKLVPIDPTEKMINEGSCASSLPGPHYISEDCAKQCWEYMLVAAPEAKP